MEKYAIRASVAIPFLLALAFGLAGLTVVLIDAFGYRDAYFILAGGFVALGLVGIVAVRLKERHDDEQESASLARVAPIATAAVEAGKQLPKAVAGGASEAATSFRGFADIAARNWPLVLAASIAIILLGGTQAENRQVFRHRSRFWLYGVVAVLVGLLLLPSTLAMVRSARGRGEKKRAHSELAKIGRLEILAKTRAADEQ